MLPCKSNMVRRRDRRPRDRIEVEPRTTTSFLQGRPQIRQHIILWLDSSLKMEAECDDNIISGQKYFNMDRTASGLL
jgi:hypothetical protein